MGTISEDDAREAYQTARRVHASEIAEREGVKHLVASRGMNAASASDYIRNFRQMVQGKPYHRTLNSFSTELFLEQIREDLGEAAAHNALASVRGHIVYYEGVGGSKSPSLRKISDEFEASLGVPGPSDNERTFLAEVLASEALSLADREKAIAKWPVKPKARAVATLQFDRNPHVVAAVLERANGKCESCNKDAPFKRSSNGTPYLEVHHKKQLAHGGEDTVKNAIALCPNCHRRAHHG